MIDEGSYHVERLETFEESAVSESRQVSQALERNVLVARDYGKMWRRHELEFRSRVAVRHENVEQQLERALPVHWLA